jgi:hypothetical protein
VSFCSSLKEIENRAEYKVHIFGWFKTHVILSYAMEKITKISHGCALFTFRLSDANVFDLVMLLDCC